MSVFALLSGKLQSAPESRTSKSDKPFVLFTLRVANGNELQFWKVFAFAETTQAELLALNEGDALSVQGVPRFRDLRSRRRAAAREFVPNRRPYREASPAPKRVAAPRSGDLREGGTS